MGCSSSPRPGQIEDILCPFPPDLSNSRISLPHVNKSPVYFQDGEGGGPPLAPPLAKKTEVLADTQGPWFIYV